MRFSHPMPARRAKPAMAGQSRAAVFGADRGNHFLVASGAMAGRFRNCHYKPAALAGAAEICERCGRQKKIVLGFESRPLPSGGSTGVSLRQRQPQGESR